MAITGPSPVADIACNFCSVFQSLFFPLSTFLIDFSFQSVIRSDWLSTHIRLYTFMIVIQGIRWM